MLHITILIQEIAVLKQLVLKWNLRQKLWKKLAPLEDALCKNPPVNDGFLGCSKNTENMDEYNEMLKNLATDSSGISDTDFVFFWNVYWKEIYQQWWSTPISHSWYTWTCEKFSVFLRTSWLAVSETEINPRIVNQIFEKNWSLWWQQFYWFPSKTSIFTTKSL